MITNYFGDLFISAIGWTVLHSFWQISLIALLMSGILYFIEEKKANLRYVISLAAMFLAILSATVTFLHFYLQDDIAFAFNAMVDSVPFLTEGSTQGLSGIDTVKIFFQTHLTLISNVWICGVLFFVFRLIGGYAYLQVLTKKHQGTHEVLSYSLNKLKRRLSLDKNVTIFQSKRISTPMVVGYVKPCILFPLGVVNQLSISEVEAIIIHELAHIKRHDFLVNILQSFGEIIFYYHPAAWWISANIKSERENCCDDIAIKHCGDSMAYAKVLVKLQDLRFNKVPRLALGLSRNRKSLVHRVRRILNQPKIVSNMREKFLATILFFTVAIAFASERQAHFEELHSIDRLEKEIGPLEIEREMVDVKINRDTFPSKNQGGKISITKSTEDERIELESKDGEITRLKINGKEISPENYDDYDHMYQELDFGQGRKGFGFFNRGAEENFPMQLFADSIELWYEDGNIDSIIARSFGNNGVHILSETHDFPESLKSFSFSFDSIMKGLSIQGHDKFDFDSDAFSGQIFKGDIDLEGLMNEERLSEWIDKLQENNEGFDFHFDSNSPFKTKAFGGNKMSDQLARELNRDGLLEIGKDNKVELSGKHLNLYHP